MAKSYICTPKEIESVERVKKNLMSDTKLHILATFFKVFSDPTRIKIVNCLTLCDLCVCDIAHTIGKSHSVVSHQLRHLKQLNIVKFKYSGRIKIYFLTDYHIRTIFKMGVEHINE